MTDPKIVRIATEVTNVLLEGDDEEWGDSWYKKVVNNIIKDLDLLEREQVFEEILCNASILELRVFEEKKSLLRRYLFPRTKALKELKEEQRLSNKSF